MKPRLTLAKDLLKETGVIFISIDEHEFAQLKLLLDELSDLEYVENFVWWKPVAKNHSKYTSNEHEYVLCYAKNKEALGDTGYFRSIKDGYKELLEFQERLQETKPDITKAKKELAAYKKQIRYARDSEGNYIEDDMGKPLRLASRKWMDQYKFIDDEYRIYREGDAASPDGSEGNKYTVLHPVTHKPCTISANGWRYAEDKMMKYIAEGRICFGKDETKVPQYKRFLTDNEDRVMCSVIYMPTADGKKSQVKIFGKELFPHAKPPELIKHLLSGFPKDTLVLDFFAGSGTTAQAVMELNHEDGGSRRWILCTNNENDICRSITKPRVDALIKGEYAKPPKDPITFGGGYDYLTLDYIAKTSGNAARATLLTPPPAVVLASLVEGVPLETYENTEDSLVTFSDDKKAVIVLFQSDAYEALTEALSRLQNLDKIVLYVRFPKPTSLDALLKGYKVEVKDLKKLVAENYYKI